LSLGDRGRQAYKGFENTSPLAFRYARTLIFDLKDGERMTFDLEADAREHRGPGRCVLGRIEKEIF